jgi:hypothetical protein
MFEPNEKFDVYGNYNGDIPAECVGSCSHSGDCSGDVSHWVVTLGFSPPRDMAINYLASTGGWTRKGLQGVDDETLAQRVLWVACCEIKENGTWPGMVN